MPAQPTLTGVDNANGTATITVAGSDAGSTNALFYQNADGNLSATWTAGNTRVSDGTITLTAANAYYWVHVTSTLAGATSLSTIIYQRISDGKDSIQWQIMEAIQSRIQGLTLAASGTDPTGTVQSSNVILSTQTLADQRNTPGIVITPPEGEIMEYHEGTNQRDDIRYPILVQIIGPDDREQIINFRSYLKWRQQISWAFRNQRMPGVSESFLVYVTPVDRVEPKEWAVDRRFVSGVVITTVTRENRGLS